MKAIWNKILQKMMLINFYAVELVVLISSFHLTGPSLVPSENIIEPLCGFLRLKWWCLVRENVVLYVWFMGFMAYGCRLQMRKSGQIATAADNHILLSQDHLNIAIHSKLPISVAFYVRALCKWRLCSMSFEWNEMFVYVFFCLRSVHTHFMARGLTLSCF